MNPSLNSGENTDAVVDSKTAASVDLAPVTFYPSQILWWLTLAIYISIFFAATFALFPLLFSALHWPLLWLCFTALIGTIIYKHVSGMGVVAQSLSIQLNSWLLRVNEYTTEIKPYGDVVLWSWLIILPVQEKLSGKKHYLIALPDSMSAEDWRRLRVWLLSCVKADH